MDMMGTINVELPSSAKTLYTDLITSCEIETLYLRSDVDAVVFCETGLTLNFDKITPTNSGSLSGIIGKTICNKVYIDDVVTSIPAGLFLHTEGPSSMDEPFVVRLSSNIQSIGKMAFYGTSSLSQVEYKGETYTNKQVLLNALYANNVTIGDYAFDGTKLSE